MRAMRSVGSLVLLLGSGCPDGGEASDETEGGPGTDAGTTAASPSAGSATAPPPTSTSTTDPSTSGGTDPASSSGSTAAPGACPYTPVEGVTAVELELVADGFSQPLLAVGDPVDADVTYVLEKGGSIKRIEPGVDQAPAEDWFTSDVTTVVESGLVGLAFHPEYEKEPLIYVAHTPASASGAMIVTEYAVVDGVPDPTTARDVIGAGQPEGNHNGGMVVFGPDNLLYLSLGDGGVQDDGCGHGQDGSSFLGTILRVDPTPDGEPDISTDCAVGCPCTVPGPFDYTIPDDNPFVGNAMVRDEVWAYGLRNPWRMSFDQDNGALWVGDVGQDAWEEVHVLAAGDNAGWGDMEGFHCFTQGDCDATAAGTVNADGYRMPVVEYENAGVRCSVVGLGNYHSCEVPQWQGVYFYGDYCSSEIWGVRYDGDTVEDLGVLGTAPNAIFGGGYNAHGDVFVATAPLFGPGETPVFRIAPQAP